jgi:hypothetical protein
MTSVSAPESGPGLDTRRRVRRARINRWLTPSAPGPASTSICWPYRTAHPDTLGPRKRRSPTDFRQQLAGTRTPSWPAGTRLRGEHGCARRESSATGQTTFSCTVMSLNRRCVTWTVLPEAQLWPRLATAASRRSGAVPWRVALAGVRGHAAPDELHERGLAPTVRPDQPGDVIPPRTLRLAGCRPLTRTAEPLGARRETSRTTTTPG